jgi:hypothetical protein
MIVQMTMTRNELFLLKEMLPLWKKYVDAFVFMVDTSDDGTYEYLMDNSERYNILSVLVKNQTDNQLDIESDCRQRLYDECLKFSDKLVCLDTDEYLDGTLTKEELNSILDNNKGHLLELLWVQYINRNSIRVDGPWAQAWSPDRVGSYPQRMLFPPAQMHSQHMPYDANRKSIRLHPNQLFIAHLQWIDKKSVALKQYYWKVVDYVNRLKYNAKTIDPREYDVSVNNFSWQYAGFPFPLKVRDSVYSDQDITKNYKYIFIQDNVKKYNIPNLNDWGMGIHP